MGYLQPLRLRWREVVPQAPAGRAVPRLGVRVPREGWDGSQSPASTVRVTAAPPFPSPSGGRIGPRTLLSRLKNLHAGTAALSNCTVKKWLSGLFKNLGV